MESSSELIAWCGSILLALCAVPEAYRSWKNKRSDVGLAMLLMWGVGEVCTLLYVLPKNDLPLIINYGLNIIFICVILYYRIYPEEGKDV